MTETTLLTHIKQWLSTQHLPPQTLGIGDDGSIIQIKQSTQLVTSTDLLIQDVHFRLSTTTAEALGWKSLAVNLSDLAAMNARPLQATIALGLPQNISLDWLKSFYQGLLDCANTYNSPIIGGDLSKSNQLVINITVNGTTQTPLLQRQAKPGDYIYTSGPHGHSGLGLFLLENHYPANPFYQTYINAHQRPVPRLDIDLNNTAITSLTDSSDGLYKSISLLLPQSLGAHLDFELDSQFVFDAQQWGLDPLTLLFYGGEDYQLVATSPTPLDASCWQKIGVVTTTPGIYYRDRLLESGNNFEHFKNLT
jgi:thiamine-monophosphate kinase